MPARVGGRYADGVHVVELVSVVDEEATFAAVATAIDVSLRRRSSIDDAVVELLRPRECLLLLDNCEHVVDPVAALVSRVVREAPQVSIVAHQPGATRGPGRAGVVGRTALDGRLSAEGDSIGIPAAALFVERARAADPRSYSTRPTTAVVVEICRRLDGIRSPIELAAARARATDVREIALRLDERFRFLKAMRRGGDPRHRTMHDAISWSYEMLPPKSRSCSPRLSVFAGSFDLRSAEAMGDPHDALDLLTRLTERSMLSVRRPRSAVRRVTRCSRRCVNTGDARLSDDRRRGTFTAHAAHFADEAGPSETELHGPDEHSWIGAGRGVVRRPACGPTVLARGGRPGPAFELITDPREYAMRAMRYEVFAWATLRCTKARPTTRALAPLLTGMQAYGAWVRGEFELAMSLAEETPSA